MRRRAIFSLISRSLFLSIVTLAVLSVPLVQPVTAAQNCVGDVDPNSMLVEGQRNPLHLSKVAPVFQWAFPFSGTQQNWQIQMDSESNFAGHGNNIWFWESGTADKGGLNSATTVRWGDVFPPSLYPRPLDTRSDLTYWRVRVRGTSDPNWDQDPNRFSCGVMKLNQIPLPPGNLNVVADGTSGQQGAVTFPAIITNTNEFFVSMSGSDSNPGTMAQPFRTINRGVRAPGPGDTLSIRGGTYNENVQITGSRGVASGTPGNPITVRRYPGDGPVVIRGGLSGPQPISTISMVGSSGRFVEHWIVDGLTIGGSGVSFGVYIYIANNNTVKNLSFDSNFNPSAVGVRLQGPARDNKVLDSLFDTQMFEQLEITSAQHTIIRGNEFTKGNDRVAINFHSSGSHSGVIEDNIIHDTSAREGVIQLYLSCDGTIIRNNLIYNVTEGPNGNTAAVQVLRCGKALIENNTFVNTKRGISYLEFSRYITARNNVIVDTDLAFDFMELLGSPPGATAVGAVIAYNYTFNNRNDFMFRHPGTGRPVGDTDPFAPGGDPGALTLIGNCFGGPRPSGNTACDPKFVNAAGDDYRLDPNSPLIDAGDPNTPVPIGGGTRVDVGGLESGSARPYAYQPHFPSVGDRTPRITWTLLDPDNFLNAFDPNDFPTTDSQTAFELEIDTSRRFDSVNGSRPIFASGTILSTVEGYTVPESHALPPGDYYVRVRQRDQYLLGWTGAWSNSNIRFRIESEPQSPFLTQHDPIPGALAVDPNQTVTVHVVDFGTGVDQFSLTMHIGVDDPNAPTQVTPQITEVTPLEEFALTFSPSAGTFTSGSTVYIKVHADDLFGSPPLDEVYSFAIQDAAPPPIPGNLIVVP
jgi:hypothetical protein